MGKGTDWAKKSIPISRIEPMVSVTESPSHRARERFGITDREHPVAVTQTGRASLHRDSQHLTNVN